MRQNLTAVLDIGKTLIKRSYNDVSFGAPRLLNPDLKPMTGPKLVAPLQAGIDIYRSQWRHRTGQPEAHS